MLEERARLRPTDPAALLATWFGSGFLPVAPGTWASLIALPFAAMLVWVGGPLLVFSASAAVFAVGIWAANEYMAMTGVHDPPAIVIDEVVAQWLTLALMPIDPVVYLLGFLLFRVFDVLKPWPAGWLDRRVGGAFGVMIDDIAAAAYAGGALAVLVTWFLP